MRGRSRAGAAAPALLLATLLGAAGAGAEGAPASGLLDPLSAVEYQRVVDALVAAGHADYDTLYPLITLDEPLKARVLAPAPGPPPARRAFVIAKRGHRTFEGVVDVGRAEVVSWREAEGVQPGILLAEEWSAAQEIVRRHPPWRRAIAERGISDPAVVVPVPLTVGYFGEARERERRLVKVVSFDSRETTSFWGRPIEGLIAVVDLDRREVLELIDGGVVPVPAGPRADAGGEPAAARPAASPIALSQPGGPSYRLAGQLVRWDRWSFHWRIDPRLGPVLSLVAFGDPGRERRVLYQASLSELFVPYADPDVGWYFRAYMDAGEYGVGKLASPLVLGADCPENATLLEPLFADDWGNAYLQPAAACLFERYAGDVAWRHFEAETGERRGRRLTELVLRSIPAIGNYDYVLDWIFRPDGSLGVSVGATGTPQVKGVASRTMADPAAGTDTAHGRLVAERTVAPNHDHFFCFRLDLDVDGRDNSLLVERLARVEAEAAAGRGGWVVESRAAATESQGRLRIDLDNPALWRVINPSVRGPLGYPVSYQLAPRGNAVPLFPADDPRRLRAGFIDHHLWVTPYRPEERYAAGLYPNQSRGGDGLPRWTRADRTVEGTDIVLWYTLGMHHVVRAEDWPIQPTARIGFELRPFDFFERNPALDLPPP